LARQLHVAVRRQVEHRWAQDELEHESSSIVTLQGRRMGIVGLGSIGREVAGWAAAFWMTVTGVRRRRDAELPHGVDEVLPPGRLDAMLSRSDVVVVAVPQTAATDRLIGARELECMKPGALLVNISRGSIVDDNALV